jgi:hypothetical protein
MPAAIAFGVLPKVRRIRTNDHDDTPDDRVSMQPCMCPACVAADPSRAKRRVDDLDNLRWRLQQLRDDEW